MTKCTSLRNYSHVPNFTQYMDIVFKLIDSTNPQKILNLPAGNGLLSKQLREVGHTVTDADINDEKPHYVFANLEASLPFKDNEFDIVICLEGIEHIINPEHLISEFNRVTKPHSTILLSLPNIQSIYSRLCFLFTGEFYLFSATDTRLLDLSSQIIDRGHISSLSYYQLVYLFKQYDFTISLVEGDKYKRKVLMPIYLIIIWLNFLYSRLKKHYQHSIYKQEFNPKLLLSRSLILKFIKS